MRRLLIFIEGLKQICDRHKHLECFVPEPNDSMESLLLILEEYLLFPETGEGVEKASDSMLTAGVHKALENAH